MELHQLVYKSTTILSYNKEDTCDSQNVQHMQNLYNHNPTTSPVPYDKFLNYTPSIKNCENVYNVVTNLSKMAGEKFQEEVSRNKIL
ncbi:12935_t:CDS:2, partial [Dentiscutata heterogama]